MSSHVKMLPLGILSEKVSCFSLQEMSCGFDHIMILRILCIENRVLRCVVFWNSFCICKPFLIPCCSNAAHNKFKFIWPWPCFKYYVLLVWFMLLSLFQSLLIVGNRWPSLFWTLQEYLVLCTETPDLGLVFHLKGYWVTIFLQP